MSAVPRLRRENAGVGQVRLRVWAGEVEEETEAEIEGEPVAEPEEVVRRMGELGQDARSIWRTSRDSSA